MRESRENQKGCEIKISNLDESRDHRIIFSEISSSTHAYTFGAVVFEPASMTAEKTGQGELPGRVSFLN